MAASPYCFAKKLVDVRSLDPPKYCYNLDAHECERRDDEGAVHNVCFGSPTNEGDDDSSAQLIRFQDTHTLIISHSPTYTHPLDLVYTAVYGIVCRIPCAYRP